MSYDRSRPRENRYNDNRSRNNMYDDRRREPESRDTNLKIGNCEGLSMTQLRKECERYGSVLSIKPYDKDFLVDFRNHRDAADAKRSLDGFVLDNHKLVVVYHQYKLHISSLAFTLRSEDIFDCFKEFGVKKVSLIPHEVSGRNKGFGFIEFSSQEFADEALERMQGFELNGRRLRLSQAHPLRHESREVPREVRQTPRVPMENQRFHVMQKLARANETTPTRCIVLKNMVTADQVDKRLHEEISYECEKYGKLKSVVIYQEPVGKEIEVKIYVLYDKADMATLAQTKLDQRYFDGRTVVCEFYDENDFIDRKYEK
jgi:hypothetical protein